MEIKEKVNMIMGIYDNDDSLDPDWLSFQLDAVRVGAFFDGERRQEFNDAVRDLELPEEFKSEFYINQ